ncbi:MAG: zinc-ribbon domain-containing protein [Promethearchaeota archaeon]
MFKIFKGKNQLIRLLYLFICIIFLLKIIIPSFIISASNQYLSISFYIGVYIEIDYSILGTINVGLYIPALFGAISLIVAIIFLIIVLIKCNKLKKGVLFGLAISSAISIIASPIIFDIVKLILFGLSANIISKYYIYILSAIFIILGLIVMITEPKKTPDISINEVGIINIVKIKFLESLHHQFIRMLYLAIIITLIVVFFIPASMDNRYGSTIYFTSFYYGIAYRFYANPPSITNFTFSFLHLALGIGIMALVLILSILVFLYNKLNKGALLGLGIPCAIIMILISIIPNFIEDFLEIYKRFYLFDYDIFILSFLILGLGLFEMLKVLQALNTEKIIINGQKPVETKPISPLCNQCGAALESGAKFCVECGKKL